MITKLFLTLPVAYYLGKKLILTRYNPLSALAEDFSVFFDGKIDRIMLDLETKCRSITTDLYQQFIEDEFKTTYRLPTLLQFQMMKSMT